MGLPPTPLSSSSREADERNEPGAERVGAQVDEVVVEIVADGDDDGGADARPRAAPGEAFGRLRAVRIVVPGDDEACDAGRRRERAEAAGGERSRCGELRDGGDHRQHGLDAFADEQRRAVGGMAESHGEAVDAAERLARRRDARLGGPARIEPGALYAEDGVVVAGDGGDQRRKPADGIAVAVAKLRVEAQCREAAARQPAGKQIGLGMGAGDRAALPPQAAGRLGRVKRVARARRR